MQWPTPDGSFIIVDAVADGVLQVQFAYPTNLPSGCNSTSFTVTARRTSNVDGTNEDFDAGSDGSAGVDYRRRTTGFVLDEELCESMGCVSSCGPDLYYPWEQCCTEFSEYCSTCSSCAYLFVTPA